VQQIGIWRVCAFLAGVLAAGAASGQHFKAPTAVEAGAGAVIGRPVAMLASPTTSFGAVEMDGWAYMLGGYTGTPHSYNRAEQSRVFQRVNLLDPAHVERLPDVEPVQSATLEAYGGRVIRVGGLEALNSSGEEASLRSLATVEAFDPVRGVWEPLPSLPSARSSHDSAVVGETLYVVGGWTLDDAAGVRTWSDDLLALDLADSDAGWRTIGAPFARRALASVAVDGLLVAIGGMPEDFSWSQRVDIFDPESSAWSEGPSFPVGAFGAAATVVDGEVIASAASGEIFAWRPGDSSWRKVASLTFPRFFHQLAATPEGGVLALGGISQGTRPRHIERVNLGGASAEGVSVSAWSVPFPGQAKNRQGVIVAGQRLHVFGGNNSTGQHDFEPRHFLDEAWMLHLARMEWEGAPEHPVRRQSMSALRRASGVGVSVGGFGHEGARDSGAARTHAQGHAFDYDAGAWSDAGAPDLPVSRSQFGLVEHEGRLWVFGGLDYDPRRPESDHFRHLSDVLVETPSGEGSRFVDANADLPTPRRAFGGALMDGRYYMVGGMRGGFERVERCDVFDFDTRAWSTIASPSVVRINPELVALGGRLFLAGGSSERADGEGLEADPTLEMYDPRTDTWTTVMERIPVSGRHMRMMAYRGQLLLYSVHNEEVDAANIALIDVSGALDGAPEGEAAAMAQ